MITIAQAVANLTANPRPALFLDTCALLDIVGAPLRNLTATVRAGLELRTLTGIGTIQLFVQDIVPREWTDNLPSARKDGEDGILAFTATWELAHDLGQRAPPLPALSPGTLIDELEKLSKELLDAAEVIERDHHGMSLAIDRVAAKLKPTSGKSKGHVKDSHILCHALRLSRLLTASAYLRRRIYSAASRRENLLFRTGTTGYNTVVRACATLLDVTCASPHTCFQRHVLCRSVFRNDLPHFNGLWIKSHVSSRRVRTPTHYSIVTPAASQEVARFGFRRRCGCASVHFRRGGHVLSASSIRFPFKGIYRRPSVV